MAEIGIAGELVPKTVAGVGMRAQYIVDDNQNKTQEQINQEMQSGLDVFDISAYNLSGDPLAPTQYSDLPSALGVNGANVPAAKRKGGMSVKFINSTSGKYEQWRLVSASWSTTVSDWQGVDDMPTAGSHNLVESGGVKGAINNVKERVDYETGLTLSGEEYCEYDSSGAYWIIPMTNVMLKQGDVINISVPSVGISISRYFLRINNVDRAIDNSQKTITLDSDVTNIGVYVEKARVTASGNVSVTITSNGRIPTLIEYLGVDVQTLNNNLANTVNDIKGINAKFADKVGEVLRGSAECSYDSSGSIVIIDTAFCSIKQGTSFTVKAVGIGTVAPKYFLYLNGTATPTGGITDSEKIIEASSDITSIKVTIAKNQVIASGTFSVSIESNGTVQEEISQAVNSIEGQISSVEGSINQIKGGTLQTFEKTLTTTGSGNVWVRSRSALDLGVNIDHFYLDVTGVGTDFTSGYYYDSLGSHEMKSSNMPPYRITCINGELSDFGVVIIRSSITTTGEGKTCTATISIPAMFAPNEESEETPSCEELIIKPAPYYVMPNIVGFSNFIPRIYIEGLMNASLPKLRIDGNVTSYVSSGQSPVCETLAELTAVDNQQTYIIPLVISHYGYDDYTLNITEYQTSPSKLVGKSIFHMNIGSSNTDGSERGETALEDFLCNELSDIWDGVKDDSSKIDVRFVGTKCENCTFTFNSKSFTTTKSCNEGHAGWAIAGFLRHIFLIKAFGESDSTLNAYWCSLGLRTKTRNGVSERDTPVDYSYSSADQSKAFEMRNTCHGYYDADPCEDLWNYLTTTNYMKGRSFTYNGVTYTFGQSYTGSQADDNIQIAYIKYVCTTGVRNPVSGSRVDNPFYDYDTVQSTNGLYAFSLSAYLEKYRTMDDSGNRLSNESSSKGTRVTDTSAYDVCTPTSVKIEMGGNDYNLGVNAEMTANDNKLMADLIYAFDSTIKIAIQEYRYYGALNPSFYSLHGLDIRRPGFNSYRMLYHKEITDLFENGSMDNYYHLSNYTSQTVMGYDSPAFDTLNDQVVRQSVKSDALHSSIFAYFDKAYQVVSWLCYINR